MLYTEPELLRLLSELESDLVERKESWSGDVPDKARQAICAFANDLPHHQRPGVLFIGVRDDGKPSGLPITDQLLLTLADIKSDGQTLPAPTLFVEKRVLLGHEVAIVTVHPADAPPVRFRGRIWIRTGPRRGIASAQDERVLNEKRRHRDLPYDLHPMVNANLESLSRVRFEEDYLPKAFAPDILVANERTYPERLAACRMVDGPESATPTVLGLLILGKSPQHWLPGAYLQFLRIAGVQWSDPVSDEAAIHGPVDEMLRRLDEKLEAHNRTAVDFTSQPREVRHSWYPRAALQQLCYNAVMHRAYEHTHAPTRVYWFDDRVEIHNPGGAYGAVTPQNFGQPGVADYRNPHLAEAMKVLGLVQRFGVGIATARAQLQQNGNPPLEFQVEPQRVVATVRRSTPGAA